MFTTSGHLSTRRPPLKRPRDEGHVRQRLPVPSRESVNSFTEHTVVRPHPAPTDLGGLVPSEPCPLSRRDMASQLCPHSLCTLCPPGLPPARLSGLFTATPPSRKAPLTAPDTLLARAAPQVPPPLVPEHPLLFLSQHSSRRVQASVTGPFLPLMTRPVSSTSIVLRPLQVSLAV